MTNKDIRDLKFMLDALEKHSVAIVGRRVSLDEIVGESYIQELANMTEAEAVHHLRSVSREKLLYAYSVLSIRPYYALRANHPVLAEACFRLMASSKGSERILGAGEIGIWLEGTKDKNASHALSLMISNNEETDAVRSAAYDSIELINNRKNLLDIARRNCQALDSPSSVISEIDWDFVGSFL